MALQPTLKKVATKLIAKFGRAVTHITVAEAEYNPVTGESTTETSTTISGFVSAYSAKDYSGDFDASRNSNQAIVLGDAPMLTVSAVAIDDKIVIDGATYSVTMVQNTPLEDGIVMYQCNLRAIS